MRTAVIIIACAGALSATARAEDVGCTSTTFRIFGANDKVCVQAFDDPDVAGVACYVSQARTGGVAGSLGVAEDPSRFAVSCRQTGPIALPARLPKEANVFNDSTSLVWKNTKVIRMFDAKRNTLVYVAISRKLIDGSPMNSVSAVPVARWEAAPR
ncbi:MAG: CreA family protein [Betaproteobacteria bacterium]